MEREAAVEYLKRTVSPCLGCTEPACIALCAAAAVEAGITEVDHISMTINSGLYKNGMSVGIPGFDRVGIAYAAALGALIGHTKKELQIFEDITPEISDKAKAMVEAGRVEVEIDFSKKALYAYAEIRGAEGCGIAEITKAHTHIVKKMLNGAVLFEAKEEGESQADPFESTLLSASIADIYATVKTMTAPELQFLKESIAINTDMARAGIEEPSPVGIAATLKTELSDSLMERMMLKVASAIEARLDGRLHTVVSSAGSGSKGLAVTLPVVEAAKESGSSEEEMLQALAFGHLMNSYINLVIGKLSSMCTCAVAASTAASMALVYLWGGTAEQAGYAVKTMTGTVSGMICDGGKTGCGMKLAQATASAFMAARMALLDRRLRTSDGICGETPESCINHIADLANLGMARVDERILKIMLAKA